MKLLSAVGDSVLFCALAFLSVLFAPMIFSPAPGEAAGMGDAMMVVFFGPFAAVSVIIGVAKYRLWSNRLFWSLLVTVSLVWTLWVVVHVVFTGWFTTRAGDVGALLTIPLVLPLLTPAFALFAIPLWQLVRVAMKVAQK